MNDPYERMYANVFRALINYGVSQGLLDPALSPKGNRFRVAPIEFEVIVELLLHLSKTKYVLLFFFELLICCTPNNSRMHHFTSRARLTGEKIRFTNHLVSQRYRLDDSEARQLFHLIQLLLFQIAQGYLWNFSANKPFEKMHFSEVIKKLRGEDILTEDHFEILDRIRATRNEFSHSNRSLDEVRYDGVPLRYSYSHDIYIRERVSLRPAPRNFFLEDTFRLTEGMISVYKRVQLRAFDYSKLAELLQRRASISLRGRSINLTMSDHDVEDNMRRQQGLWTYARREQKQIPE